MKINKQSWHYRLIKSNASLYSGYYDTPEGWLYWLAVLTWLPVHLFVYAIIFVVAVAYLVAVGLDFVLGHPRWADD